MTRKVLAFVKKDFLGEINYPINFLTRIGVVCIRVAEAYVLGQLFSKQASPYLSQYGGNYFFFSAIGIAFTQFLFEFTSILPNAMSTNQLRGSFEILLTTPITPYRLILCISLWPLLNAIFSLLLYLFLVFLIAHYCIMWTCVASAFIILLLALVCFCSLGVISIASCLVFKQEFNIRAYLHWSLMFFGGTYFPIAIFPDWLQKIAYLLPLPYILNPIREIFINGASLMDVRHDVFILSIFALILCPLSIVLFNASIRCLKRDGTAAFY